MKLLTTILSFSFLLCMIPIALSQDFDFGEGESKFSWGEPLNTDKKLTDLNLKIGFRLQTGLENQKEVINGVEQNSSDFYARRLRFQFQGKFLKTASYYMDLRNDRVDQDDRGDRQFTIGDAYLQIKNIFGSRYLKLKLLRAKVDVSRTQTISSSRLIFQDRPGVTDFAADYVSEGRRASNLQILGNYKRRYMFQAVVGDGIQSDIFTDVLGNTVDSVEGQNLMIGGKIKIAPFKGWEEVATETFFGKGKHFTFGFGQFNLSNVRYKRFNDTILETGYDRSLQNYELSFHYGAFSFVSEYFVFGNTILNFDTPNLRMSDSNGGYIQTEYVFERLNFISPFYRYETWDRFTGAGYTEKSTTYGANYYAKGNKMRFGLQYTNTKRGDNLASNSEAVNESRLILTSQWHY